MTKVTADTQVQFISAGMIFPSDLNPRKTFEETPLHDLAANIYARTKMEDGKVTQSGVQMPLIVRPVGEGEYEIAAGERRWRATQLLMEGFEAEIGDEKKFLKLDAGDYPLPVIVKELSDDELVEVATIENAYRAELSELEEADSFMTLISMGRSEEDLSRMYGVSKRTVERRLQLASGLGRDGRRLLESGKIGMTHAFILSQVSGDLKRTLLKSCREGMSVRELQQLVSKGTVLVEHAIFDVKASGLEILHGLFDDGLPPRFSNPQAALAAQLEAIDQKAEDLKKEYDWVEVVPCELHYSLPKGFVGGGRGMVLSYNPVTGEVREYANVARVADKEKQERVAASEPEPLAPEREIAAPEAPKSSPNAKSVQAAPRQAPRSSEVVAHATGPRKFPNARPIAFELAAEARNMALAEGLLRHPKVGLANAVVQVILATGAIKVAISPVRDCQRNSPDGQQYVTDLLERHPGVFKSSAPGTFYPRGSDVELLDALMEWEMDEIAHLLAFLLGSAVNDKPEKVSAYTKRLAELTGAEDHVSEHFVLNKNFIGGFTMEGLYELIDEMPEEQRPVVLSRHNKPEAVTLLLERADALQQVGWVPEIVSFDA